MPLRVQPRASRNAILWDGQGLKVYTTAPPVDGEANATALALIAKSLGVSKASVVLTAGSRSKTKRITVQGFTLAEIQAKLDSDS